jgi:phosphomannomutase
MNPTLTVSGYRGIWGDTLTDSVARDFVRAFGAFASKRNGKKILVGRDGRESGPALMEVVIAELLSLGFDVVDLGMMPTPTVVFLVRTEKADGAVIVTASHNPIEYNGLKFVTASGAFTTEAEVAEIEELRGAAASAAALPLGTRTDGTHLFENHLQKILGNIDQGLIRSKKFTVALDPINSVGCTTTPRLFEMLGATCTVINGKPSGKFAHAPEPIAANLHDLETLVSETSSDIGFAQDPDGDRLVICDETGHMVSEELMLALCVKAVLEKTPGAVVINAVTSTASEDIASTYGQKTFRSKVGEANVVEMMTAHSAVIGGEGSGGVIWPAVNAARDSFVGIALILELIARLDQPISKIVADLPSYTMTKNKVAREGELTAIYDRLRAVFPEAKENPIDGLRLDFPDRSWVSIRPSNTEPIIRIFAEAGTKEQSEILVQKAKSALLA